MKASDFVYQQSPLETGPWGGLTLRDHFASQAMVGLAVNNHSTMRVEALAKWAYEVADAMLKQRGV